MLAALAIVPSLLYLVFARNLERHNREPFWALVMGYLYGATFGVGIALLLNTSGQLAQMGLWNAPARSATLVLGMAIAPFVEEFSKALGLPLLRRHLDEPEDGLIHGAAIGLGFGATENLIYGLLVFDDSQLLFETLVARSFTSMLLHAGSTALVGYGFSLARRRGAGVGRIAGLYLVAVAIHAAYNSLILAPVAFGAPDSFVGAAFLFAIVGVVVLILWVRARVIALDRRAPYPPGPPPPARPPH